MDTCISRRQQGSSARGRIANSQGARLGARWILPEGWEHALTLSQAVFFVIFSIIYLHFLWEMLATFVPTVRRRTKGIADADDADSKQRDLF